MEPQPLGNLSPMLTWTFVIFLPSMCSGMKEPSIQLESSVFVAFTGEDLSISCDLMKAVNSTADTLMCFDPFNTNIYSRGVAPTAGIPQTEKLQLELKNMSVSGEYYCKYKTATVSWFLRVRAEGYKDLIMLDYTEMVIVAVFTGVLLVFSVVGSVFAFRGHCKGTKRDTTGRKQKQSREDRKETKREEDNVDVITAQSTSFYASLETRPKSIYDVLDHSAASRQSDQRNAKAKKKDVQKPVQRTTEKQDDGVFESVYENF